MSSANPQEIVYVKLHTVVSLPPVMQVPQTLDVRTKADGVKLSIEGSLLKITYKGATGFTPLTNVICLQYGTPLAVVK